MTEPLLQAGYHVLRYNSRGVGKSTGRASFTGSSEVEDLKELTQWARSTMPDLTSLVFLVRVHHITICHDADWQRRSQGYSYGSLIVSLQPVLASLRTSHVIISYPLAPRSWLTAFRGGRYNAALHDLVRARGANVLVLYGDHDEFTSAASYDAWVNGLRVVNEEGGHSDATLKVVKVEGASHFWREDDAVEGLLDTMSSWLRQ